MKKKISNKVKIFVGYYKPNVIFQSDVFQPILTAKFDWNPKNLIKDDTGINIAHKNSNYGELSGHYWVWKNFLQSTDAEYIGFCHYRRFLDFNITKMESAPFKPIFRTKFERIFKKYTEENILKCIDGYDIILPNKIFFQGIVYAQYLRWHPQDDMNFALRIIRKYYPNYVEDAMKTMGSHEMYSCLNFVMKKELFEEYAEWMFGVLQYLEVLTDWSKYTDYLDIRTPAYIAERFFNIWIEHQIRVKNIKILNTSSFYIIGKGYGNVPPKVAIDKYNAKIKYLEEQESQAN